MSTPSVSSNVSVTAPITVPVSAAPMPAVPSHSLYVGDLKNEVSEPHLFDHFKTCAPKSPNGLIASIRLCRDWATKNSLGYAYVNFESTKEGSEAAIVALNTLNHSLIMGKPCRVAWCMRNPANRNPDANVFVKNLPVGVDSATLQENFSKFGETLSCKVKSDGEGISIGRGYVQFKEVESAKKAIETLNGKMLEGNVISVEKFVTKKQREATREYTNLYTNNLPETCDETKLKEMFAPFGKIVSAIVGRDKTTQELRLKTHEDGTKTLYGFVNFETHESAKAAAEALNNKEVSGKALVVVKASNRNELRSKDKKKAYPPGTNLYVKYIPEDYTDEDFRKLFATHGQIGKFRVVRKEDGSSHGFGFVSFATSDEAARAITSVNGQVIHGKPIYVALHQTKEQRQNLMLQQKQQRLMNTGNFNNYQQFPRNYGQPMSYNQVRRNNQQPYTRQNRNYPQGSQRPTKTVQAPMQQAQQAQQAPVKQNTIPIQSIDKEVFNKMSNTDQREALGEAIYGYIEETFGQQVNSGKITGMVLESTNGNFEALNDLIKNGQIQLKIQEAINVYKSHIEKTQ